MQTQSVNYESNKHCNPTVYFQKNSQSKEMHYSTNKESLLLDAGVIPMSLKNRKKSEGFKKN